MGHRSATHWTGGQYSLVRALLGAYLALHFVRLLPWATELFSHQGVLADRGASPLISLFPNLLAWFDSPLVVQLFIGSGCLAALLLAIGKWDRYAALWLFYLWACLLGRNPLILNPSIPFVGWLLLLHAALPPSPYGSWSARARVDPRGDWSFPRPLAIASWIVLAVGYSYSGWTKLNSPSWVDGSALRHVLENPLSRPGFPRELLLGLPSELLQLATWGALGVELLFAPLALIRRVRPWIWLAMLGMHAGLVLLIDFADLSVGMMLFHLFTFDPRWVSPKQAEEARLYYDGDCGLCHRAVRFVLAEDPPESADLRMAPLAGETAQERIGRHLSSLPDSLVLEVEGEPLRTRSDAALELGRRLGGYWRVLATVAAWIPRGLRDGVYDWIARIRHHLFARPNEACPILPPDLRERFEP